MPTSFTRANAQDTHLLIFIHTRMHTPTMNEHTHVHTKPTLPPIAARSFAHTHLHLHSPPFGRCFEAVRELMFEEDGCIHGMLSVEGEKIPFLDPVSPAATGGGAALLGRGCSQVLLALCAATCCVGGGHGDVSCSELMRDEQHPTRHTKSYDLTDKTPPLPHTPCLRRRCRGLAARGGGLHEAHAAQGGVG